MDNSDNNDQGSKGTSLKRSRRKFISGVTVGVSAGTVAGVGGGKWIKPVVDTVVLPAHAQVSPIASLGARVTVTGNEFNVNGGNFSSGSHTILADDTPGFNNLNLVFRASVDPNQPQSVPITATIDVSGPVNAISGPVGTQTLNADPSTGDQSVTFPEIDVDADGSVTVSADFTTPGGLSQRIRLNVSA